MTDEQFARTIEVLTIYGSEFSVICRPEEVLNAKITIDTTDMYRKNLMTSKEIVEKLVQRILYLADELREIGWQHD